MKTALIAVFLFMLPNLAIGQYTIILKDGRSFETNYHWRDKGQVKFFYKGGELGFPKSKVDKILVERHNIVPLSNPAPKVIKKQTTSKKKHKEPSGPGSAKTVYNSIACRTEDWLDDMIKFAAVRDTQSGDTYIKTKKCFILKGGLSVTIIKWPGLFGGKAQFAFRGVKFWTYREGLTYGRQ